MPLAQQGSTQVQRWPLPSPPTSLLFSQFKSQITPFWHQPLPEPLQNFWLPAALPCPLAGAWNASLHRSSPLQVRTQASANQLEASWVGALVTSSPPVARTLQGDQATWLQDQRVMPIAKGCSQLPRALPSTPLKDIMPE